MSPQIRALAVLTHAVIRCVRRLGGSRCVPSWTVHAAYRSDSGIVGFKKSLALVDYDLAEWRSNAELRKENEEGFAILDAYGGFELLERCLRQEPQRRISAAAAASSRFCRA